MRRGIDRELANLDVLRIEAEFAREKLIDVGDLRFGPGGWLGVAGFDGDDLSAAPDQQQTVWPEGDGFDRLDLGFPCIGLTKLPGQSSSRHARVKERFMGQSSE